MQILINHSIYLRIREGLQVSNKEPHWSYSSLCHR